MAIVQRNFVSDYSAPTDGTTSCAAAVAAWLADAATIESGGDIPQLNMPNHAYNTSVGATGALTSGLTNAIINASAGASVNNLFIGNPGTIREDFAHSARIGTVAAGATSATIITGSRNDVITDASIFAVDQWVMVCGVSLMTGSYPPSFQWNEFRKLTGVSGTTISWSEPLAYAYKQTWPLIDTVNVTITNASPAVCTWPAHGFSANQPVILKADVGGSVPTGVTNGSTYYVLATGLTADTFRFSATQGGAAINTSSSSSGVLGHTQSMDLAGPATVYAMPAAFDGEHQYIGLTNTAAAETFMGAGKSTIIDGMSFSGLGPNPSAGKSVIIRNTQFGTFNEIDKCVEYLEYDNCTGTGSAQLQVQSAGVMRFVVKGGSVVTTIGGTPFSTSIENSTVGALYEGPLLNGVSDNITVSGSTVSSVVLGAYKLDLSKVSWSFSGGTFSFPTSDSRTKNEVAQWAVPGYKAAIGYYDGTLHTVDNLGNTTVFKVLDIRQDATTTYVDTDLASIPATTFAGGNPPNVYAHYGAKTITGSATTFQEPADLATTGTGTVLSYKSHNSMVMKRGRR